MDESFAKKFLYTAAGVTLLMAALVLLLRGISTPWFENIKAEITSQPYAQTVTVSANAKVTATPDIAMVTISVVSQKATVKEVTSENNLKMNKIIDAIKKLSIEDKDITTSQYSLYPNYEYPENRPAKIVGYNLTQDITLKIRKLDMVDQVLDTATQAGANQIGQLTFNVDDASPIKKEAREKAFKTAREKAEEMAKAVGVDLGRVITFSENVNNYYPGPMYSNVSMDVAKEGAMSAPSIQPGSKEFSVDVSVTYEIKD